MSRATTVICDRCKRNAAPPPSTRDDVLPAGWWNVGLPMIGKRDICDACADDLVAWFNGTRRSSPSPKPQDRTHG